ncbi:MAG: twin-arginine translocase subunit TatC [Planctomycetota bacterium JB042]
MADSQTPPAPPPDPSDPEPLGKQMTFSEHLEELRGHVKRSVIALVLLVVVAFAFQDALAHLVMLPFLDAITWIKDHGRPDIDPRLTTIDPTEAVFFHLKIAFYAALVLGLPYFLYEMWRFIAAGLYAKERKAVMRVLPVSFALLAIGISFCFFVVLPIGLRFMLGYGNPEYIKPEIRVESYLSFVVMLSLLMGVVFQLPLVQVVLAKFSILPAKTQSEYRRAFVMGSLVAAAVITPTGDAVTLLLVSVPMFVLYEIGILAARRVRP